MRPEGLDLVQEQGLELQEAQRGPDSAYGIWEDCQESPSGLAFDVVPAYDIRRPQS